MTGYYTGISFHYIAILHDAVHNDENMYNGNFNLLFQQCIFRTSKFIN